jgi:hypothetical protein
MGFEFLKTLLHCNARLTENKHAGTYRNYKRGKIMSIVELMKNDAKQGKGKQNMAKMSVRNQIKPNLRRGVPPRA